jgi:hypothetical protein
VKRLPAIISALMLIACLTGCGDSHDSLMKEKLSTMKQWVATLEGITDEASAKAAKPKLKSLNEKMEKISEREGKLKPPTEAEKKAIEAKYDKEMKEVGQKLVVEGFRIMVDPKLNAELNDIDPKKGTR